MHRAIAHTTHRCDAWLATADRLIEVRPTALLGIALGFARFLIGQVAKYSKDQLANH